MLSLSPSLFLPLSPSPSLFLPLPPSPSPFLLPISSPVDPLPQLAGCGACHPAVQKASQEERFAGCQ